MSKIHPSFWVSAEGLVGCALQTKSNLYPGVLLLGGAVIPAAACFAVQVYNVIGTAVAKALCGSLDLILKNKSSKTATVTGPPVASGSTERCVQSFVGVLCALCPWPSGDSRDTSSTSEAGRRLGDVCIVALPVLCPVLTRFRKVDEHFVKRIGEETVRSKEMDQLLAALPVEMSPTPKVALPSKSEVVRIQRFTP